MGKSDYSRLLEIVKPVTEEEPDLYQQRLNRLREESKVLQMGWCDNKKDLIKQLAEKFLTNTTKDKDIKEIEVREKIAKNKPKTKQSWPPSLTGNDERQIEVQKGLILTEVLAQRKEHEKIAKEYKELCQIREEHEELQRQQIEADLIDKQTKR